MHELQSSFLQEAQQRGFLQQCTNLEQLDSLMSNEKITAYLGFDLTASSLHVGNLISIMLARLLQKHGHKPIILMGDATTFICDPSGKDSMRKPLTEKQIEDNSATIQKVFKKYLCFDKNYNSAIMVYNKDWLMDLEYLPFLTTYGPLFSINRMLTFDSVKTRIERQQSLSFLEFNYMILQAYDFLVLQTKHNCILQLGGSDQWGNIVNGVDLVRRKKGKEVFGLTTPLITTSDGKKMGKSAGQAIWLNAEMLHPFDFWQYWRNVDDKDVGRFLRLYTDLTLKEIKELEALQGKEINQAKITLANNITKLCHGDDAVTQSNNATNSLFNNNTKTMELDKFPTTMVKAKDLAQGILIVDLFKKTGLCTSNGETKRLIQGQGAKINDITIDINTTHVHTQDLQDGYIKLSSGKKKHAIVKVLA